ncbi:hypothetical protein POL68_27930 [Stigmatella sp. ncwal1]|uniref:Uncharacterized protein n=1 Tax=Stigmatella ashevillensis TaxID=2995309 RepID=A0ABT5DFI3_9BACT|nr:hypothetical protein [Stigmatella ashevillena]MDC0712324.1 hypothetical protein [Stigmatella ashevillena]
MSNSPKPPPEETSSPEAPAASAPAEDTEQLTADQARDYLLSVLDYGQEEIDAKAGIIEELVDLVLPEMKVVAQPIRPPEEDPKEAEALEQRFNGVAVRERDAAWIKQPGLRLDSTTRPLVPRWSAPDKVGGVLRRELFLLTDGRLVTVETVTPWETDGGRHAARDILVGAREVTPAEVLRTFDFVSTLKSLLRGLFDGAAILMERNERPADLVERSGRFFTIIAQVAVGMKESADRLRRAGDSPA